MPFTPDNVDPRSLGTVELVRLCGISGAARVTGLDPHVIQAAYELETGDVLPQVAADDPEVLSACYRLLCWAEEAGAYPSDITVTLGKALRLSPEQAERLYRRIVRGPDDKGHSDLDALDKRSARILDGAGRPAMARARRRKNQAGS